MTIVLHHLRRSRSIRIVWLLEELQLPYETKIYERNRKTSLAPPELAEVHPSGQSPLLEDDGVVYAESGNIIEHLVTKYGQNSSLIWHNAEEKNTIKYALYAAESNMMISGMMVAIHGAAINKLPYGLSAAARYFLNYLDSFYAAGEFDKTMRNFQSQVDKNGGFYCHGRLTVADIMYLGCIEPLLGSGVFTHFNEQYPGIAQWLKKINELPNVQKAHEFDKRAGRL